MSTAPTQLIDHSYSIGPDQAVLDAIGPLRGAGFALHWLHPRSKRPIGNEWSDAPVATLDRLRATHTPGANLGVRLGEPSQVGGGYLHVLDIDIRIADLADEAWDRLRTLLPVDGLPCVASGSGGESRHLYLITDTPFRSKRLATSPGKHRRVKDGQEGWSYDWEIELFGTGKQVVLPPSIHPDTGQPYRWLREFDLDLLDLGIGPFVPAATLSTLAVAEHATFAFESREPLVFQGDKLNRTLAAIDISALHYDDWIRLGQALHHQFGGSQEGFDLWLTHTRRSSKFTGDAQVREMRRSKWKSFGRYRGTPVTMASVVEWAKQTRVAALLDAFDEEDDEPDSSATSRAAEEIDPIDAIGSDNPPPADEIDEIDAIGTKAAPLASHVGEWISLLDMTENGAIRPTLHNVELIVCNDSRLAGLAQLNEFTQETVQRTPPGTKRNHRRNAAKQARQLEGRIWDVRDSVNGDTWSSARDFAIRSVLEAPGTQGGYGIKVSDRDLKAAIVIAAWRQCFHPVREYLSGLVWDGVPRVETLFVDYLGTSNHRYYRDVARLMLVAAVARVFEPGYKWDTAVILEGLQGRGKSTFIRVLGRRWFSELDGNFHDSKEMVEKMQGSWILEMPELNGFVKSEVQSIKAFISRQTDKVRLAYEARATDFPRQSILIGSTNDKEYLKDNTGGRRFLPVECNVEMIDTAALRTQVDQIWAEAFALYQAMRAAQPNEELPLYLLDSESADYAVGLQESRRVESPDDVLAGRIEEWLDKPICTGSLEVDSDASASPLYHSEVCTVQVWVECLGGEPKNFKGQEQGQINRAMGRLRGWAKGDRGDQKRFERYGKQRVFYRGGEAGRLARMGLQGLI